MRGSVRLRTVSVLGLAASLALLVATPASAGQRDAYGSFSNGVTYHVNVSVYSDFANGYVATGANYETGTIVVYECSGTGDCSNRVQIAASRNYYTSGVSAGNPSSYGHTYQGCGSITFPNTPSYSNYCTAVAANS